MWRWQSIQEYQYPLTEYLSALKNVPVFIGLESVVAGHEHTSMSVITRPGRWHASCNRPGRRPGLRAARQRRRARAVVVLLRSRRHRHQPRRAATNWDCSVRGSSNEAGSELETDRGEADAGRRRRQRRARPHQDGRSAEVDGRVSIADAATTCPPTSSAPDRSTRTATTASTSSTCATSTTRRRRSRSAWRRSPATALRTTAASTVRTATTSAACCVDSVGGTTYGGTGVYGAQVGGVWDALLGEGRNWWFFASSDWHNRGSFGPGRPPHDAGLLSRRIPAQLRDGARLRRQTAAARLLTPQAIVDGLRTGNSFTASGQLIDRLAFVACAGHEAARSHRQGAARSGGAQGGDGQHRRRPRRGCATMGEKLEVAARRGSRRRDRRARSGGHELRAVHVRESVAGAGRHRRSRSNKPVLDHIDVIRGLVSGYKKPGAADYAGQWPNDWIDEPGHEHCPGGGQEHHAPLCCAPSTSATWKTSGQVGARLQDDDVPHSGSARRRSTCVCAARTCRRRCRTRPTRAATRWRTSTPTPGRSDAADGSRARSTASVTIPAGTTYTGDSIDGCPDHLERFPAVTGPKYVSYDVAAWADLWFYSNPIYIEVKADARGVE